VADNDAIFRTLDTTSLKKVILSSNFDYPKGYLVVNDYVLIRFGLI